MLLDVFLLFDIFNLGKKASNMFTFLALKSRTQKHMWKTASDFVFHFHL